MSGPSILALTAAVVVGIVFLVRPHWGLLGLILLYPFMELIPRGGPGLNAETGLFLVGLVSVFLRGLKLLPPIRVLAPIVGYLAVMLLGYAVMLISSNRSGEVLPATAPGVLLLGQLLKFQLWPLLVFFIAHALSARASARRTIVTTLTFAVGILALSGLVDYVSGTRSVLTTTVRATGLARNANVLGILAATFSVVVLDRALFSWRFRWERLLHAILYVLMISGLVLSQSRKAWLAVMLCHFVWLAYRNRALLLPAAATAALTLTIGYGALPSVIRDRIDSTFSETGLRYRTGIATGLDQSIGARVVSYRAGLEMFMERPVIGHGFNSFRLKVPKYAAKYGYLRSEDPHSLPLKVLAESGLLGMASLIWMSGVVFLLGVRLARRGRAERDLGICFVAVCAGLALVNLAATAMVVHLIGVFFWIFFGCVVRAISDPDTDASKEPGGLLETSAVTA